MDVGVAIGRRHHAAHFLLHDIDGPDFRMRVDRPASGLERALQSGDKLAVVHLMIAWAMNARGDVR
jgi:hypothetical protein